MVVTFRFPIESLPDSVQDRLDELDAEVSCVGGGQVSFDIDLPDMETAKAERLKFGELFSEAIELEDWG